MHAYRKFVQDEMDRRGWKAVDLAKASGISKQVLSNLLGDDRDELRTLPSEETIKGLAGAFGVQRHLVLQKVAEAMRLPTSNPITVYAASSVSDRDLVDEIARRLEGSEERDRSTAAMARERSRYAGMLESAAKQGMHDERALINDIEVLAAMVRDPEYLPARTIYEPALDGPDPVVADLVVRDSEGRATVVAEVKRPRRGQSSTRRGLSRPDRDPESGERVTAASDRGAGATGFGPGLPQREFADDPDPEDYLLAVSDVDDDPEAEGWQEEP